MLTGAEKALIGANVGFTWVTAAGTVTGAGGGANGSDDAAPKSPSAADTTLALHQVCFKTLIE